MEPDVLHYCGVYSQHEIYVNDEISKKVYTRNKAGRWDLLMVHPNHFVEFLLNPNDTYLDDLRQQMIHDSYQCDEYFTICDALTHDTLVNITTPNITSRFTHYLQSLYRLSLPRPMQMGLSDVSLDFTMCRKHTNPLRYSFHVVGDNIRIYSTIIKYDDVGYRLIYTVNHPKYDVPVSVDPLTEMCMTHALIAKYLDKSPHEPNCIDELCQYIFDKIA
jgi:hypothetical protein